MSKLWEGWEPSRYVTDAIAYDIPNDVLYLRNGTEGWEWRTVDKPWQIIGKVYTLEEAQELALALWRLDQ